MLAQKTVDESAVVISRSKSGIEFDGLIEFRDGLLVTSELLIGRPAADISFGIIRHGFSGHGVIFDGSTVIS